ncbi:MAG: sigma-70 family RNA polymerase sigma factor [Tannerellaceae bacterium]|nr:sigma-70 family RNA polymerase sigma factor [Tannerellaceae bacterium]
MLFFKKNISKLTDEELLQTYCTSGDSEYFGELYNRYIPLIYGVCLKYLKDPDDAEDAVMEIFEHLLPRVANYEIRGFKTWVYSVARNHCLQILRKDQPEIFVDFTTHVMESDEVLHLLNEDGPDEERMAALNRCIEKLPEHQRTSIVLFFMEELSYVEIVEKTGYALSKVKSYIQNGKRNLAICIKKSLS